MVVSRQKRLDELRFAQQRADFPGGFLEFDAPDFLREPQVRLALPVAAEMRCHPVAQIDALADIQRHRVFAVEQVHTGRLGQRVQNVGRQLRRQARDPEDALDDGCDDLGGHFAIQRLDEGPDGAGISECAMPVRDGERMARHDGIEAMSLRVGIEPARELHRAQRAGRKRPAQARKFMLQESVIEARVVRDEDTAIDPGLDGRRDGGKRRRVLHHRLAGIAQRAPFAHPRRSAARIRIHADDPDFGDAIGGGPHTRGLEVHERH